MTETKRDVFDELLKMFRNSMALTHEEPVILDNDGYDIFGKIEKSYIAALPDDLPVIPKAVGVSIKEQKEKQSLGGTIFDAIFAVNTLGRKGVGRVVNWIVDNNEVFARAWVLGVWRVEETGEIVKLEAEK